MAVGSVSAGKAYVTISAMDKTRAGIEAAKSNLNSFVKKYDAISQNLLSKGSQMAAMGAGALTGPLAALNSYAEFDRVMLAVKAKMEATGKTYQELSSLAREYGRATSWTAQQVADNMLVMAGKGLSKENIQTLIPQTLSLARAVSSDDLASVTDMLVGTIQGTGGTIEDAARYADVFASAVAGSSLGAEDLGVALQYVADKATVTKFSIEQLSAGLMALADANIKGSKAGTALRNFMARLEKKDSFFQSYGIQVFNEDESLKSFEQIFADIKARLGTLSQKEQMHFLTTAFGLPGQSITNMFNSNNMGKYLERLRNSQGSAERMANEMEGGVWGSIQRIKSAWAELWLNFGKVFAPIAKNLEWLFVSVPNWLSKITTSNAHWIRLLAMAAALLVGIGGILITVGLAVKVVSIGYMLAAVGAGLLLKTLTLVKFTMMAINGLVAFLLSPIGAAVVLAGALLAAFTNFFGIMGTTLNGFVNLISQGRISDAWELLVLGMKAVWLDFTHSVTGLFQSMIKKIMGVMSNIGPLWRRVMGDISFDDWAKAYDDEFRREGEANKKRIEDLKAKVEAAGAGTKPKDLNPLAAEGSLPEAKLGEMSVKKLAGAGAIGNAIASAITAGTSEFYQKFQENKANAEGQAALDTIAGNTGEMADTLRAMQSQIEDLNDTVGL